MGDPVLEVEELETTLGGVVRGSSSGEGRRAGSSGLQGNQLWLLERLSPSPAQIPNPDLAQKWPGSILLQGTMGAQMESSTAQGTLRGGAAPPFTPIPGPAWELGRNSSCAWGRPLSAQGTGSLE